MSDSDPDAELKPIGSAMKYERQTAAALCGKKGRRVDDQEYKMDAKSMHVVCPFPTVSTHLVAQLSRRLAVCSQFSEEKSGHEGREMRRPRCAQHEALMSGSTSVLRNIDCMTYSPPRD